MIGQALGTGVVLYALMMLGGLPFAWVAGYELKGFYSRAPAVFICGIATLGIFAYFVRHEFDDRRSYEAYLTKLSNNDDVTVERHAFLNLSAGHWPASGKIIEDPWETLPARYRLTEIPANTR